MPSLAIRKSTLEGLSGRRRKLLGAVLARLDLGEPAVLSDGSTSWYVWDDDRIGTHDIAVTGCLAANWSAIPAAFDPDAEPGTRRAKVREHLKDKLVWPVDIPDGADPYAAVLAAQGAPTAIRAFAGLPEGWMAVEVR